MFTIDYVLQIVFVFFSFRMDVRMLEDRKKKNIIFFVRVKNRFVIDNRFRMQRSLLI